jgi:hypothetical protein
MADALDVIRACQCVIVWRRQTLIDENRKPSRNIETRSQASGRAPFAFFCDALARILMTGSRRDSESLATIRTRLFGALAPGVLDTIGELILLRHIDKPSQWIPIVPLTRCRTGRRLTCGRPVCGASVLLGFFYSLNGTLHEETPSFSSCARHPGGARDHERTMNHV